MEKISKLIASFVLVCHAIVRLFNEGVALDASSSRTNRRAFPSLGMAIAALLTTALLFGAIGCSPAVVSSASSSTAAVASQASAGISVDKNGEYTDKDHVAAYIHAYGTVPKNYVTKTKARKAGWVNTEGNLWDVLPGKSIGGGGFFNDDGLLPDARGREWFECDIDYAGGFRNAKRIVYSNDGLIYYTDDHYRSFVQLY